MTIREDDPTALPGQTAVAGSAGPDRTQLTDWGDLVRELKAYIIRNPNVFGSADIYNVDYQNPQSRAAALAALLACLTDGDGRPAVAKFTVIIPPGLDEDVFRADICIEFENSFSLITEREIEQSELSWFEARLQVVAVPDSWSSTLLGIIRAQPNRTMVIVTEAARYRDSTVDPFVTPGASTPLRPEDVWAPQLHALATAAIELARERELYIALDANELSPRREALSNLLRSIDGCGVIGSGSETDPDSIVAERVHLWEAWIREGQFGRALNDIEQLSPDLDANKRYLRIQILHRAGHLLLALQEIREELALGRKLDAESRVKLAVIAQDANASKLAIELLVPAIAELKSREDLELALMTAHEIGSADLEAKVAERLSSEFPGTSALRQYQQRALLLERDYAGVAALMAEEPDSEDSVHFYNKLALYLSSSKNPDYGGLIGSADGDAEQADAFRMACVSDALNRSLISQAFELAVPIPETPSQMDLGERLLLQVLRAVLLRTENSGSLPVRSEQFQEAVLLLVERLSNEPHKHHLREGLARLIQPSIAGAAGLALMAAVVLHLASRPIRLRKHQSLGQAGLTWLHGREPFMKSAFAWLESESPVVIGKLVMPEHLLTEPADEVLSAVASYLHYAPLNDEEDIVALQGWLAIGASVAPHSSDPDYDLKLMRLAASKLASLSQTQLARDLAEQTLLNSTASSSRRRLGWFTMADVYHRCRNQLEGLLFVACTLAADDTADERQAFHELIGVARFLRDCGLFDYSATAIKKARDLLQRTELSDSDAHQVDTLELQIRHVRLKPGSSLKAELDELLFDATQNAKAVLDHNDQIEPIGVMLGQLLRQASEIGSIVPSEAEELFGELCERMGEASALLVRAMSAPAPSVEQMLALLNRGGPIRYSDDVGYDMFSVALVAGRALSSDDFTKNPAEASFALETLADRGVAVPDWDEAAEPPPVPKSVNTPADIASSISKDDLSVVQAGFDAVGRLVRVSAINGELEQPVREPEEIMHEERFKHWKARYPYAYGTDTTTENLFYTTTADIRLSNLPTGPTVVVADVNLQAFPPNLFFVGEQFAGRDRPMAAAPSLAWLEAARAKGMIGDGRICAWISTAEGEDGHQTLPMIADRLQPTFDQYGIMVDTGTTLPATFSGASMAVITAHGGIHPEHQYFHVVSDDGALKVTAGELANALRNIGIVILFVCSGGRADKHPQANTTLGLAKQILDRGCAAVIASPWPLDARVPSHWLPTFLDHWFQGARAIEANYAANQIVDQRFAQDPARGLAMTIIGNPTLRRNQR